MYEHGLLYAGIVGGKVVHSHTSAHEVHLSMLRKMKESGTRMSECAYLVFATDYKNERVLLKYALSARLVSGYQLSLEFLSDIPEWLKSHRALAGIGELQ